MNIDRNLCKCGNEPIIGGQFWYESKYGGVTEGIISAISVGEYGSNSIKSTMGQHYYFNEISVRPKSVVRDEKIDSILGI